MAVFDFFRISMMSRVVRQGSNWQNWLHESIRSYSRNLPSFKYTEVLSPLVKRYFIITSIVNKRARKRVKIKYTYCRESVLFPQPTIVRTRRTRRLAIESRTIQRTIPQCAIVRGSQGRPLAFHRVTQPRRVRGYRCRLGFRLEEAPNSRLNRS